MYLDNNLQEVLRQQGVITKEEVITKEGDLFIAVNVVSNDRRIVQVDDFLLESKTQKTLLKG